MTSVIWIWIRPPYFPSNTVKDAQLRSVIKTNTNLGENKFSLPCKVDRSAIKVGFQFGTVTAPNRGGERISLSFDF